MIRGHTCAEAANRGRPRVNLGAFCRSGNPAIPARQRSGPEALRPRLTTGLRNTAHDYRSISTISKLY
jgi:hypothetical protein